MRALAGFLMGTGVAVAMTACAAAVALLTLPAGSVGPKVAQWAVFVWWLPGLAGGLFGAAIGMWLDERGAETRSTPNAVRPIQRPRPPARIAEPPRRPDGKNIRQPAEQRA
jgi:hypothetical protein